MSIFPVMCAKASQCTAFPDVCMTPAAPSPIPIPYPNIGNPADGSGTSKVKVMNSNTLRQNDTFSKSMGDNAGTAPGGTISGQFMGSVKVMTGSPFVKADGQPVGYQTCMTAHNGNAANAPPGVFLTPAQVKVKVMGAPGAPAGVMGEPNPVDDIGALLRCSQLAQQQIEALRAAGWNIRYSRPGDNPPPPGNPVHPNGSWCNRSSSPPEIVIGASNAGNSANILGILAHEMGHANFTQPTPAQAGTAAWNPAPGTTTQSQADFTQRYLVERHGRDEGEAALNNIDVANDAAAGCPGPPPANVPVMGAQSAQYRAIAANGQPRADQQRAIGQIFGTQEQASTTGQTYGQMWQGWEQGTLNTYFGNNAAFFTVP